MTIGGILVAGGICWGIYSYIDSKNQIADQEKQVTKLEKQVNDLYQATDKEMLKTAISEKDIQAAEKSLDAFKGEALLTPAITKDMAQITKDWSNADYMYTYQMQVEKLLDPNGVLRADAKLASIEAQRKDLVENTKKEAFAKSFDPIVEEATAQQNQIEVANQQVTALYSNFDKKEVKKGLTRATYNQAKASVDKIKQAQAKQTLTANLKPADEALKKADEKEAKAEEAAKVAAAQEASASQEEGAASSSSNEASTNSGSSSTSGNGSTSGSNGSSSGSGSSGSSASAGASSKSSGGSSGSSSSSSKSSASSAKGSSSKEMKPGDTFEGTKTGEGYIDGPDGNTWESFTW